MTQQKTITDLYIEKLESRCLPSYAEVSRLEPERFAKNVRDYTNNILIHRQEVFIPQIGFALATNKLVQKIKSFDLPVLGVGSGTGYLECALDDAGVDVIATDAYEPSWHSSEVGKWFPVEQMDGTDAVRRFPGRLILMSWPPCGEPFAFNVLKAMKPGQILVYIGEGNVGACGDSQFHKLRHKQKLLEEFVIPQFFEIRDTVCIYEITDVSTLEKRTK